MRGESLSALTGSCISLTNAAVLYMGVIIFNNRGGGGFSRGALEILYTPPLWVENRRVHGPFEAYIVTHGLFGSKQVKFF